MAKTIVQRIALEGGDAIKDQLKALGDAGEKAFNQIQKAATGAQFTQFSASLKRASGDLVAFGRNLALLGAGVAAAAGGAGAAILELASSSGEAADQAGKAAQSAGVTTQAYTELAFAAKMSNLEQADLDAGMSKLNKTLGAAANGSKDAVELFQKLGVSIRDAKGKLRAPDAVLLDLADAFAKVPDGALKSALAIQLFGKAGAKLLPFLNEGKKGLIDLGAEARALGVTFTDAQAKIGDNLGDALDGVSAAARGVKLQLGLIFAPAITQAATILTERIKQLRPAIQGFAQDIATKALPLMLDFVNALTGNDADVSNKWILDWRDGAIAFGQSMVQASTIVLAAIDKVRAGLDLAATAINGLFGTQLSGDAIGLVLLIGQLTGGFRALYSSILLAKDAAVLLFALVRANPWIAAITLVAGGIALWATRTDEATRALRVHEDLIGKVGNAYDQAGHKVAEMSQQVKDAALIQARLSQEAAGKGLSSAIDEAINSIQQFDGLLPHAADQLFEVFKQFQATKDVEAFRTEVAKIGASNPELGKLAQQFLDISENAHKLTQDSQESANFIGLLTGKLTDSEFAAKQAALGITGYSADSKAAAAGVKELGTAVDDTKTKVDGLSHTITVFRGGGAGGKLSQETFNVIDGVAVAAEKSKTALDEVGTSAKTAGDKVKAVADDIASHIRTVPEGLTTNSITPAVDGVVNDLGRIKPAADEAALGLQSALNPADGEGGGLGVALETAVDGVITDIQRLPPAADEAVSGINTAFSGIDTSGAQQAATAVAQPFQALPSIFSQIFSGLGSLIQGGFGNLTSVIRSLASQIRSEINSILAALRAAAAAAAQLRAQASSSSSSSGGGSQGGFASGGFVSGPGGPKTDSIIARLSNGEYVFTAEAVKRIGLDALNFWNYGKQTFKGLSGFSLGGSVERFNRSVSMPKFAGGGSVKVAPAAGLAGMANFGTFKLDFGLGPDQVFDIISDTFTATRLQQFALREAATSLGRRPGK